MEFSCPLRFSIEFLLNQGPWATLSQSHHQQASCPVHWVEEVDESLNLVIPNIQPKMTCRSCPWLLWQNAKCISVEFPGVLQTRWRKWRKRKQRASPCYLDTPKYMHDTHDQQDQQCMTTFAPIMIWGSEFENRLTFALWWKEHMQRERRWR